MTTHWEWEKGLRGLLGPKTLGPGPHVDNGLRGPREWQKVPRGRMGLDLLIPVHCPLVTECHFPPLPCGCQGNWANTIPARSPKPSPHPTKPFDASRRGRQAWEGGSERGRDNPSCFFFISFSKESPHFSHSSSGGHRELGS